ncbi:MAG: peptide-N-glycosidase F-related protein [Candidatus Thalassarchaeaceae archaeon]|nr:peptide-N-glycosidase F-related protein [Candidatus Thalassarchaeaceae archaeon]
MRRSWLALILTTLMLSSGCLGMLDGGDSSDSQPDDLGQPPTLSVTGNGPYLHDENVVVSGNFDDENPATVSIQGSMANGAISRKAATNTNSFALEFGILPSGTHSVKITVSDENGHSVVSVVAITVQDPPEEPVSISAFPPVLYVEGGESTIARAKIIHSALNTCSGTWEDELERFQTAAISGEYASVTLGEVESSFNGTFTISCGSSEITTDSVSVYVFVFTEENPDLDGDGIPDDADRCVESSVAFASGPTNDIDGDGCHDISEDTDDDDDGRPDTSDRCARGLIGWDSSNTSLDHDSDGCQDTSEDDDDDDDTITDSFDNCPLGPVGWQSTGASDYDRDGCRDADDDLDDDNDGTPDTLDSCPKGVIGWIQTSENDYDMDGCRDLDEDGDDDSDGVIDFEDQCSRTQLGAAVNIYGCASYEWDDDGDGVMDDTDQCSGTPAGLDVNEVGCADLDGDGIFANVDQCPDSEIRWTSNNDGCTVLQVPVAWDSGPYSTERFGVVGDFTIQTKSGNWVMSRDWDGESTYLFIFNQDSSSYMSSLWSQDIARFLDTMPENSHVFFGSYDSDYRNDIDAMNNRVNSYRNGLNEAGKEWVNSHVHYIDQQGGAIGGALGSVISDWSAYYYGIDRFQQWREIGSLYNWAGTHGVQYRFDYIAKMPLQFNSEFPTEMRRHDPGVTVVDIMVAQRHIGGWQGGHSSLANGSFPNASVMEGFNTMELYMHHGCSEHRDRYQKSDGSDGGCHEWDYSQYMQICDEVGNSSTCSTEFGYWITTYGREGRWLTDISPRLFELIDGGDRMFRYRGANGGWLNVSVYLSNWEDDGLRPTGGELAFNGGSFRGEYNNESQYKRVHDLQIPDGTERVEIYAVITGHGFGKDSANCAEFCNHEHRYSMNGHVTQEDHAMAGNSTVASDNEGCAKEMHNGALTNQFGTWPYGRAGWCAGQDVKPWTYDISQWIDWVGNQNSLRYQGLYNGQNYVPQNEQSGANQNIHANIWVVYYTNISSNISAQMDGSPTPMSSENDDDKPQLIVEILREEECATEDE